MKLSTQNPATKEAQILTSVTEKSTFQLVIPEADGKSLFEKFEELEKQSSGQICKTAVEGSGPDSLLFDTPKAQLSIDGHNLDLKQLPLPTTFHLLAEKNHIGVVIGEHAVILELSSDIPNLEMLLEAIKKRNQLARISIPKGLLKQGVEKSHHPKRLSQATFIEARAVTHAISDAPSAMNYQGVEGEFALIHAPKKARFQTRFQPSVDLLCWWGNPKVDLKETGPLFAALKKLNFETNMTFQVVLACLLQTEHARRSFTLDEVIKLIGRETDAKRSKRSRQILRREIWENLLAITSMPVIGARNGVWREPSVKGEKRALMPKKGLTSKDPLLVFTGIVVDQDPDLPPQLPENFSLTAGEWLMPLIGNREMLSDFGDVLKLAQIPRGKVSGAWAACIGLALQQKWREQATKAEKKSVSRGKETKVEVLKFRPFTRRELLTELFKCDDENSPNTILSDPKGRRQRAETYWKAAIEALKKLRLIGYYHEVKTLEEMNTNDLNTGWLDQPLDIRPSAEHLKNALEIHNHALEAKTRARRSGKKTPSKSTQEIVEV